MNCLLSEAKRIWKWQAERGFRSATDWSTRATAKDHARLQAFMRSGFNVKLDREALVQLILWDRRQNPDAFAFGGLRREAEEVVTQFLANRKEP